MLSKALGGQKPRLLCCTRSGVWQLNLNACQRRARLAQVYPFAHDFSFSIVGGGTVDSGPKASPHALDTCGQWMTLFLIARQILIR